ncbi:inactivation of paternal X chromosome, partial [Desmophyllum pertusum]
MKAVSSLLPTSDDKANDPGVRFICGPAVPLKIELPSQLPEGLQLIGATLNSGTHYAVLSCQSFITKGTRFGPYKGTAVKPSDVGNREDTAFMWEVFSDQDSLSHYIDGQSEPENWMKFVNCARHGDEQNLALVQDGDQLYYECCKDVFMGEELLVWYGKCYTLSMGIPTGLNVDVVKDEMMNELTGPSADYSCERCGKVFAYKYYRDRHLKYTRCVDQGDRKFPCTVCNRSFDKRDRLRIHILHVHEKHRPHQCTVC